MAQRHPDPSAPPVPADALAGYLRAQATEFLRALRLHRETGAGAAGSEGSVEAARALRCAARRISAGLHTFQAVLDPDWSEALRPELAWVSGTLAQEHAYAARLDQLLLALHRLSGAPPLPPQPTGASRGPHPAPGTHPLNGPTDPPRTTTLRPGVPHTTGAPADPSPGTARLDDPASAPSGLPPHGTPGPDPLDGSARPPQTTANTPGDRTTAPADTATAPGAPHTDTATERTDSDQTPGTQPPTHTATTPSPHQAENPGATRAGAAADGTGTRVPGAQSPVGPSAALRRTTAPSRVPAGRSAPARDGVLAADVPGRAAVAVRGRTVAAADGVPRATAATAAPDSAAPHGSDNRPRRHVPPPDRAGLTVGAAKAGALLDRQLTLARTRAHSTALQALGSSRFHGIADKVAVLASEVPLSPAAAGADLRPLADAAHDRLADAVAALPLLTAGSPYNAEALTHGLSPDPAPHPQDAPWHQVRLLLRLHRYAREVLRDHTGADPSSTDRRLLAAGEALDRHRAASEAAAAAAHAARTPRIAPATAYALGVLHADQRHEVEAARYAFQRAWQTETPGTS